MPEFDKAYKESGGEVLFIMLDLTDGQRETIQKGAQYVKEQGFSFPVYFDTAQEAAYTYGIRAIPTTLFIDKDGYIVTGTQGAINGQTLRRGIGMIRDQ
jgi:thiol-disulfide isomerase/thioredoxin